MQSLKNKTVLVTGAGGFIGSHLAERLVSECSKVKALVHYNALGHCGWLSHSTVRHDMEIVHGDITDPDSVSAAMRGCDIVFHLAALIAIPYSYLAPSSYVRTNINGTLNVLQAARATGNVLVLQTSTSEVYGTARTTPINENHPLQGQSPYSASKIAADKLAESFHLSFGLPVITIRPFNTFGPRQSQRAVIPTIIGQCLNSNIIKLGSLTPTRDLNFVSNTVDGFVRAAMTPAAVGATINLGTGRHISIGDLAVMIGQLCGKELTLECENARVRPEKSEVGCLLADYAMAKNVLNWCPAVSLEDGLKKTIEWIKQNAEQYSTTKYVI